MHAMGEAWIILPPRPGHMASKQCRKTPSLHQSTIRLRISLPRPSSSKAESYDCRFEIAKIRPHLKEVSSLQLSENDSCWYLSNHIACMGVRKWNNWGLGLRTVIERALIASEQWEAAQLLEGRNNCGYERYPKWVKNHHSASDNSLYPGNQGLWKVLTKGLYWQETLALTSPHTYLPPLTYPPAYLPPTCLPDWRLSCKKLHFL